MPATPVGANITGLSRLRRWPYTTGTFTRWCDLNGLRKIDLCGGINSAPGYESVDLHGGRIAADLNQRWPFGDGEVGVFRAHDALEHLRDPIHTMTELHRCLAPQGWLLSQTPSTRASASENVV